MDPKPNSALARILDMPGARYHADFHLVTWRPVGIFDDPAADRLLAFIESKERVVEEPFDRFIDLSGLTRIELSLNHVFDIAQERKKIYRDTPIRSAFIAEQYVSIAIARMYQELMADSHIMVEVFPDHPTAATWLGVPEALLRPPTRPNP